MRHGDYEVFSFSLKKLTTNGDNVTCLRRNPDLGSPTDGVIKTSALSLHVCSLNSSRVTAMPARPARVWRSRRGNESKGSAGDAAAQMRLPRPEVRVGAGRLPGAPRRQLAPQSFPLGSRETVQGRPPAEVSPWWVLRESHGKLPTGAQVGTKPAKLKEFKKIISNDVRG